MFSEHEYASVEGYPSLDPTLPLLGGVRGCSPACSHVIHKPEEWYFKLDPRFFESKPASKSLSNASCSAVIDFKMDEAVRCDPLACRASAYRSSLQEFQELKQEATEDLVSVIEEMAMNLRSLNSNLARLGSTVSLLISVSVVTPVTSGRILQGQGLKDVSDTWSKHFDTETKEAESKHEAAFS